VGRIRTVSASATSREAVAWSASLELLTRPRSAPSRSSIASSTVPPSATSRLSAPRRSSSTLNSRSPSTVKPATFPSESFRSRPRRPATARSTSRTQRPKNSRVGLSKAENTSSSSTVGSTWTSGSRPPSASSSRPRPGASSMYVSPSSVFWRRISRASRRTGA
jgi:hypothetical protein